MSSKDGSVAYIVSTDMIKIASLLPSNKKRSLIVHSLIKSLGLLDNPHSNTRRIRVINPRRATRQELAMYHSSDYLDFILRNHNSAKDEDFQDEHLKTELGLEDDCPAFPGLSEYVQIIGGATLTAVDALRYNVSEIAINWDGGRHHAHKSHASGFCYVADCILAILMLRKVPRSLSNSQSTSHPIPRVLYLDLDLHFSNAVSSAFSSVIAPGPPNILTLSIHHTSPGFFPATPRADLPSPSNPLFDPFHLSVPLLQGASNSTYATIWPIVEDIKDVFQPDYIVVQCGVDALAGDPCRTLNWSLGGSDGSLGWCISRIIENWRGKKLLLGGGGYNSANAARAWAYITSITLGSPLDLETDIPDHTGFPLYAPSFTLDVPAGNMQDHNTPEYLANIQEKFGEIIPLIQKRMTSSKQSLHPPI